MIGKHTQVKLNGNRLNSLPEEMRRSNKICWTTLRLFEKMGDLTAARALANRIRLGEDPVEREPNVSDLRGRDSHPGLYASAWTLISASVTPLIESQLNETVIG